MSSKCIRDTVSKVKTKYQESDPYRLAAAMHIIVKKLPLGTDPNCCKGFCMRECRKTCIVINCDLPEIIQQIILIHEIGHALLHQKTLQIKCFHDFELFDGVSQCEYEAKHPVCQLRCKNLQVTHTPHRSSHHKCLILGKVKGSRCNKIFGL